jgi:hypothetical protein
MLILVNAVGALLTLVLVWVTIRHDKRHVTFAQMRWRADYENWLTAHGHPRGIYGRYPPHG